ncbi:hypothetical protein KP509_39G010400 [Ceratopteris richardii]|uniref:Uncharacterized protein n=1 Tax=Ceratopteris richardii TaxID=49495 RepID=A0A8T2PYM9_CERRI|nr:hypothetical protein KP509_39G010400 [Ceratopteris richardii]
MRSFQEIDAFLELSTQLVEAKIYLDMTRCYVFKFVPERTHDGARIMLALAEHCFVNHISSREKYICHVTCTLGWKYISKKFKQYKSKVHFPADLPCTLSTLLYILGSPIAIGLVSSCTGDIQSQEPKKFSFFLHVTLRYSFWLECKNVAIVEVQTVTIVIISTSIYLIFYDSSM